MISKQKLAFWIKNNYNVLLVGKHGVGKSSLIKEAFDDAKLNWQYFSASTMDPWVDLVGVPKEVKDEDGNSYLDLIRPKAFQNDDIEAIFFDEFSRSHQKVRNAVMELIQFKSINGKRFKNLKIVWAAINPDDDEDTYDVDRLDPAQEDRFHVKIDIPYKLDKKYFSNKYGVEVAESAIEWWNALPEETRDAISPRRLDYALDMLNHDGDVRDVLPDKSGVAKLLDLIKTGPVIKKLKSLYKACDHRAAEIYLKDENINAAAFKFIKELSGKTREIKITNSNNISSFILQHLSNERIAMFARQSDVGIKTTAMLYTSSVKVKDVLDNIMKANINQKFVKQLRRILINIGAIHLPPTSPTSYLKPYYNVEKEGSILYETIRRLKNNLRSRYTNTTNRKRDWKMLSYQIPKNMRSASARLLLGYANSIAKRSRTQTLFDYHRFLRIVNHVMETIMNNDKLSKGMFITSYRSEMTYIIRHANCSEKFKNALCIAQEI